MILKGEMSMLNVLHLQELDIDKICTELKLKRDGSPQFFLRIPIVLDCAKLDFSAIKKVPLQFATLKNRLLQLGFVPLGARNMPKDMQEVLLKAGWTIMPVNSKSNLVNKNSEDTLEKQDNIMSGKPPEELRKKESATSSSPASSASPEAKAKPGKKVASLTIDRPVRSGQQIYAAGGDLTILAATSAGSEIMADGSIHVYGALRGRVLAGVNGNQLARIYCSSLQAELIVIAGRYQLLDESNTTLIGKPAMIRLDNEKLIIEPLS